MLLVLKRTVSMRPFSEHPKHMLKLMGKKIITILRLKNLLKWPYDSLRASGDYCHLLMTFARFESNVLTLLLLRKNAFKDVVS